MNPFASRMARRRLLDLHARLRSRANGAPHDPISGDAGDWAAASLERDVAGYDGERILQRVRAIEAAILRVDAGVYHLCERCGEEIGARRLEAIPETSVCRSCSEEMERAHKGGQ